MQGQTVMEYGIICMSQSWHLASLKMNVAQNRPKSETYADVSTYRFTMLNHFEF